MSLTSDAELQELFRQEMSERVERLLEGARAMRAGKLSDEVSGTMFREGHTIKGTARVMGFEAIARVGASLEQVWRQVQQGETEGSLNLANALEELSNCILGSVGAPADEGSGEMIAAHARLKRLLTRSTEDAAPGDAPDGDQAHPVPAEAAPARAGDTSDLGGLLGALETWASEERARVNAANLYRLINTIAAVGVETQGLHAFLLDLADSIGDHPEARAQVGRFADALSSLTQSVETAKHQALSLASVQLKEITNTYPQLLRYLAKKVGKEIRFELVGDDEAVDRQVLERIADPLRQLLVNAVEHGIEPPEEREAAGKPPTATLSVRAQVKDHRLEIVIEDDGRGVDWGAVHRTAMRRGLLPGDEAPDQSALRSLLFAPGFSTVATPSELVGDGSGLTAVTAAIEALHGSFRFETEPGQGTRVTLAVPTSRALQDAIIVRAAGQQWGIPETAIVDVRPIEAVEITKTPHRNELTWHDQQIPVASFAGAVGLGEREDSQYVVVLAGPVGPVALTVPDTLGQRQVAAKELGPLLSGVPHLTGAALLGGGDVVVLVDPSRLAERARELPAAVDARPLVLVVDDSQGARQVVAAALISSGFETMVAGDVDEALEMLLEKRVDALVVDYSMPGSDGVALVERVRNLYGAIPIVMLSGVAGAEDQERAKAAGVDAYFDKADFREGALANALKALVAGRPSRPEEVR